MSCCAVLALKDVLQHVALHLTPADCQRLSSACRALRNAPALLEHVTAVRAKDCVQPTPADLPFLRRLSSLRELTLTGLLSLHHCHHLSSVSSLRKLVVSTVAVADLIPLSCLPALQALTVDDVEMHCNLQQLAQLTKLKHRRTPSSLELQLICNLRTLELGDPGHISCLTALPHLHHLQLHPPVDDWSESEVEAAPQTLRGLASLRVLSTRVDLLFGRPSPSSPRCSQMAVPHCWSTSVACLALGALASPTGRTKFQSVPGL